MSRLYEMHVNVEGFDPAKENEITDAATNEWNFNDWYEHQDGSLSADGQSNLCGGETEKEFAERLTKAIWKANGKFCKVEVCATCMEDLPHETYILDEEDYQKSGAAPDEE